VYCCPSVKAGSEEDKIEPFQVFPEGSAGSELVIDRSGKEKLVDPILIFTEEVPLPVPS
jgi:hypothetical protein